MANRTHYHVTDVTDPANPETLSIWDEQERATRILESHVRDALSTERFIVEECDDDCLDDCQCDRCLARAAQEA